MRSHSAISALILLPLACSLLVIPSAAHDAQKDESTIRNLITAFETAHNNHDAKAFAAIFTVDADFTNVRGKNARGRKAIEEFHRPLFEGDTSRGNSSFKNAVLKIDEVRVRFLRPDVATVDFTWTQTGAVTPDGRDRGPRKGLASWVVTKEEGIWQVAVMHNMDIP